MADVAVAAFPTPSRDDGGGWTDDELRAAVVAYRDMHELERAGKHVPKGAMYELLRNGDLQARSRGSISRRMYNISAVLEEMGMDRMRGYKPLPHVGANVRVRLQRIIDEAWAAPAATTLLQQSVRTVPVGAIRQESYEVPGLSPRTARRVEQALLVRYEAAVQSRGRRIVGHAYDGGLRCDAFDETLDVLIEAKASARREFARMALGQLLDYRRYEEGDPTLAVLMPARPSRPTYDFLIENGVEVIWEQSPGSFADSRDGMFS